MTVSEASLAFCLLHLRKGVSLDEVKKMVESKFEGYEKQIAVQWINDQKRINEMRGRK